MNTPPDLPNPGSGSPRDPREELEIRITALLLGELPEADAATLRARIQAEPELAAIHQRLRRTTELVVEASREPDPADLPRPEAPTLDPARRNRLLAAFRSKPATVIPMPPPAPAVSVVPPGPSRGNTRRPSNRREWLALAAMLVVLLGTVGTLVAPRAASSFASRPKNITALPNRSVAIDELGASLPSTEDAAGAEFAETAAPADNPVFARRIASTPAKPAEPESRESARQFYAMDVNAAAAPAGPANGPIAGEPALAQRYGLMPRPAAPSPAGGKPSVPPEADAPTVTPQLQQLARSADASPSTPGNAPTDASDRFDQRGAVVAGDRLESKFGAIVLPTTPEGRASGDAAPDAGLAGGLGGFGGGGGVSVGGRLGGMVAGDGRSLGRADDYYSRTPADNGRKDPAAVPPTIVNGVVSGAATGITGLARDFDGDSAVPKANTIQNTWSYSPPAQIAAESSLRFRTGFGDLGSVGALGADKSNLSAVAAREDIKLRGSTVDDLAIANDTRELHVARGLQDVDFKSKVEAGQKAAEPGATTSSAGDDTPTSFAKAKDSLGRESVLKQERADLREQAVPAFDAESPVALGLRVQLESKSQLADKAVEETEKRLKESESIREETPPPPPTTPEYPPETVTATNPFSTFSLNVSDVSFRLAAGSLERGTLPAPGAIRAEEFINAFDYGDSTPPPGAAVGFAWERARHPFAHNRDILRFSVRTAAAGREPGRPLNLVLLVDNSGSMERADRVRIRHECLRVLAQQLQPADTVSVVSFARTPRLWIDGSRGDQARDLADRIGGLAPEGGTHLESALDLAYQTARRHHTPGAVSRVILLTDGAANLGDVQPESLREHVIRERRGGIALDCFGIGWEGLDDQLLEQLSRNGDGRYGFINSPEDAATRFAGQLTGALRPAASDVKVQVEFNPRRVSVHRQIGYARHQLTKEQFRDNTVDAAELAAAESGNALYVAQVNPAGEGPLATVRVRFKVPATGEYQEQSWAVPYEGAAPALDRAAPSLRLAAVAAGFAEWLGQSPFAAGIGPDALLPLLNGTESIRPSDPRPAQLKAMLEQARSIAPR